MKKIDYVNVKQGTLNSRRYSNGNVLPIIGLPHGMATFSLQTNGDTKWFFDPTQNNYEGIRLTHQPSPWTGDFGHLLFFPQSGREELRLGAAWSSMRKEDTVMKPNYLKVRSLRYGCTTELTPSKRGAIFRVKYDYNKEKRLVILPFDFPSYLKIDCENRMLFGWSKALTQPVTANENFAVYFVLHFDSSIDLKNTPILEKEGKGEGISVAFENDNVEIKLAMSFISLEQAEENFKQELECETFDSLKAKGEDIWGSRAHV